MTFWDWLIDLTMIGLVLRQVRGRRLTTGALLLPVALVVWACATYLHTIPTAGNDLLLVVPAALTGLALGAAAGLLTRVHRAPDGAVIATATLAAASLWVLGVGSRLAFQLYATHGGGTAIGRFSVIHHLDAAAWTAAILLLAFTEVLTRTALLWWRGRTATWRTPETARRGRAQPEHAGRVSSHGIR